MKLQDQRSTPVPSALSCMADCCAEQRAARAGLAACCNALPAAIWRPRHYGVCATVIHQVISAEQTGLWSVKRCCSACNATTSNAGLMPYVFVKKGGGWFELASAAADAPLDRELDPLSVIYCAALALDGRWQCKRTVQQTVVQ